MKHIASHLILLLLFLSAPVLAQETFFVDGTGEKIAYGLNARRIVSLAPNVTEMLFFVGLGDRVIGRSSFCNFPPEAAELPTVGGFVDTSLEKIVALKPDLVVAYQGNSLELIAQLRQLKITVVAFPEATSLRQIGEQMQLLGAIVVPVKPVQVIYGPELVIESPLQRWNKRLEQLRAQAVPLVNNKIFYGMPGEVAYTAAPGSFVDDLINIAGGINVVPPGKQRWPQVNAEFILAAQPDWLLIGTPCAGHTELERAGRDIRSSLSADPVWRTLPALRKEQIVVIEADLLLRPGPRILDALEQLSSAVKGGTR